MRLQQIIVNKSPCESIDRAIFDCKRCPSSVFRAYPMPGFYGQSCVNGIAVIAQNPGMPNDVQKSKVFEFDEIYSDYISGLVVSRIGEFLANILPVSWDYVFYSNVVKCAFPPEYHLGRELEIENCSEYLRAQLAVISPKVIVTIGGIALNFFRPGASIKHCSLKLLRDDDHDIVPMFHSSYLNRFDDKQYADYIEKARKLVSVQVERRGIC